METTITRPRITVVVLLAVESAFALLAVLAHHAFTVEYGDVTGTALQGLAWGLTAGLSGVALIPVVVLGLIALIVARARWMRLLAIAIPFLVLLGMLTVTPLAQHQKIESQLDSTPQCVSIDSSDPEAAEAAAAEQKSQRIFDSIEHMGYFSGGGKVEWVAAIACLSPQKTLMCCSTIAQRCQRQAGTSSRTMELVSGRSVVA